MHRRLPLGFLFVFLGTLAQSRSLRAQSIPGKMTECEADRCGAVWTFQGKEGTGTWGTGTRANLKVERFDAQGVVIQRTDVSGNTIGLTATYTGKRNGNRVEGNVTWTWPGHLRAPATGKWSATFENPEPAPVSAQVTPAAHSQVASSASPDLSGVWQIDHPPAYHSEFPPVKCVIVQIKNEIVGIILESQPFLPAGYPYLKGTNPADSFKVEVQGFTDRGIVQWFSGSLHVSDPDHFEFGAKKVAFVRLSRGTPGDVPCDVRNPSHISWGEAIARGWLHTKLKDDAAGACWFRIGAEQGSADAQMWYGSALLFGTGVAKNPAAAIPWLQKSAMQGSYGAAIDLAHMFATGEDLPKSEQRANYWSVRAELIDPGFVHKKDFLPIPRWATDTAGPCDASNPSHANAGAAFNAGRVAYEARALDVAACWFQISQSQGMMRANVYLGILNMFGLGVPKNPTAGFDLMKKAADANDAFALMYLANFYRYGIGTKRDPNQGYLLVQKALKAPNGLDAFTHVEGTNLSGNEVAAAISSGLAAESNEETCNDLNAEDQHSKIRPPTRDCTQTQDWFVGLAARPAKHTVEHVEEIFPEDFDPVVPPDLAVLKQAAKLGLTR
jgi:TPR repeat protein